MWPRMAPGPAGAARTAGARAAPCTAITGGVRPTCPRSGVPSASVCTCAGSTAATQLVPGAPLPSACFAERLPELVAPYARRTRRLAEAQGRVGAALGGEGAARVLAYLAMP